MPTILILEKSRLLGGLWGAVVGDALGVPVEFLSRSHIRANPVTGMRGHGTHGQPPGTWSDDSSLLLCTVESLSQHTFDPEDIGKRFVAWYEQRLWTPWGQVFDVGIATARALGRIRDGVPAETAGGRSESSNGNGSLMRILPVALRFAALPTEQLLAHVHRASAITHGHPRSQMACGLYALVIRELLGGTAAHEACRRGIETGREFYGQKADWSGELVEFDLLRTGDLRERAEEEIGSSGYVVHTFIASLWCLLTTDNYRDCVLKAVNLGDDTDTTGCVTGGLAGIRYGLDAVPQDWIHQLARHGDLERLFNAFVALA